MRTWGVRQRRPSPDRGVVAAAARVRRPQGSRLYEVPGRAVAAVLRSSNGTSPHRRRRRDKLLSPGPRTRRAARRRCIRIASLMARVRRAPPRRAPAPFHGAALSSIHHQTPVYIFIGGGDALCGSARRWPWVGRRRHGTGVSRRAWEAPLCRRRAAPSADAAPHRRQAGRYSWRRSGLEDNSKQRTGYVVNLADPAVLQMCLLRA